MSSEMTLNLENKTGRESFILVKQVTSKKDPEIPDDKDFLGFVIERQEVQDAYNTLSGLFKQNFHDMFVRASGNKIYMYIPLEIIKSYTINPH